MKPPQLQTYFWEGVNKRGVVVSGEIAAINPAILQADLKRQGITPKKVKKKSKPLFGNKRISAEDIIIFMRHLSTMINAGLPLIKALEITAKGHEKPKMREVLLTLKADVETGKTFSEALNAHPKEFGDLSCHLIKAGEQSGTMDTMLKRIAHYLEKSATLKKKIKKAMFYPIAVITVAILVTMVLLIFVIPQFEELFSSYGAQLPTFTRIVMSISSFVQHYWWLTLGGTVAAIIVFKQALKRSENFAFAVDKSLLRIKLLGPLLRKAIIARYSRTLATTLAAGIPIIDALSSVSGVVGNRVYAKAIEQIKEDVMSGQQLHMSMATTNLFPNMVVQMVAVGEESGSTEEMLEKIAVYFEEDVDTAVDSLQSLLEPLIMVILGVLIGGLVIAMYLPIFKLGSVF